jgi:hypothetical protein
VKGKKRFGVAARASGVCRLRGIPAISMGCNPKQSMAKTASEQTNYFLLHAVLGRL